MLGIIDAVMSLIGNVGAISAILILVGLALVVLEIFVPGFGIPGIAGGILLIASIFFTAQSAIQVLIMLVFFLLIIRLALSAVIRLGKSGKLPKGIILKGNEEEERIIDENLQCLIGEGGIANDDLKYFIGKKGITTSKLRPSGKIDLDGVKLDALAEEGFIDINKEITVVKVDGIRIVVKENK